MPGAKSFEDGTRPVSLVMPSPPIRLFDSIRASEAGAVAIGS